MIVSSARDATIGSDRPSRCTNVRRPGPRSSSIGSTAVTRSERTYFPKPSGTSMEGLIFIALLPFNCLLLLTTFPETVLVPNLHHCHWDREISSGCTFHFGYCE